MAEQTENILLFYFSGNLSSRDGRRLFEGRLVVFFAGRRGARKTVEVVRCVIDAVGEADALRVEQRVAADAREFRKTCKDNAKGKM